MLDEIMLFGDGGYMLLVSCETNILVPECESCIIAKHLQYGKLSSKLFDYRITNSSRLLMM
jgi:hypothetical protein